MEFISFDLLRCKVATLGIPILVRQKCVLRRGTDHLTPKLVQNIHCSVLECKSNSKVCEALLPRQSIQKGRRRATLFPDVSAQLGNRPANASGKMLPRRGDGLFPKGD